MPRGDMGRFEAWLAEGAREEAEEELRRKEVERNILIPKIPAGVLSLRQERQVDYWRKVESGETLGRIGNVELHCKTCRQTGQCHSAGNVIQFLHSHAGHYTWIEERGCYDPLREKYL